MLVATQNKLHAVTLAQPGMTFLYLARGLNYLPTRNMIKPKNFIFVVFNFNVK